MQIPVLSNGEVGDDPFRYLPASYERSVRHCVFCMLLSWVPENAENALQSGA